MTKICVDQDLSLCWVVMAMKFGTTSNIVDWSLVQTWRTRDHTIWCAPKKLSSNEQLVWAHVIPPPMIFKVVCSSHTTPFMVIGVTCVIESLTLVWDVCWVTLTINNFTLSVTLWHLAFKWVYKYLGMSVLNRVLRCMPMLDNSLQVDWKCIQITPNISMLKVCTNNTQGLISLAY